MLNIFGTEESVQLDEQEVDITRLPERDREAILARVTSDDSLPPDAFALAQNDIRRELIDRGIQPKGFYNDDAGRLQEEFNREHVAERESRMKQKIQDATKSYLQETVSRRRMERQQELHEEICEISSSPQLEVWVDLLKKNTSPQHADLRLSVIGTRVLCKNLLFNHSLRSLSLVRNALNDDAGRWIAKLLRRNTTLIRLELESNKFGPITAKELANALCVNKTLEYINLESNPLTDEEKDYSGILAIAEMLASNTSLRTISLWRTRLSLEGGKLLARGIEKNNTLLCLDIGNNRIGPPDGMKIRMKLSKNREKFNDLVGQVENLQAMQLGAAEKTKEKLQAAKKQHEYEEWIEEQRLQRLQERVAKEVERQRELQLEEDRLRQISARKAAEAVARAELAKKKRGKKGKAGGKKKK